MRTLTTLGILHTDDSRLFINPLVDGLGKRSVVYFDDITGADENVLWPSILGFGGKSRVTIRHKGGELEFELPPKKAKQLFNEIDERKNNVTRR